MLSIVVILLGFVTLSLSQSGNFINPPPGPCVPDEGSDAQSYNIGDTLLVEWTTTLPNVTVVLWQGVDGTSNYNYDIPGAVAYSGQNIRWIVSPLGYDLSVNPIFHLTVFIPGALSGVFSSSCIKITNNGNVQATMYLATPLPTSSTTFSSPSATIAGAAGSSSPSTSSMATTSTSSMATVSTTQSASLTVSSSASLASSLSASSVASLSASSTWLSSVSLSASSTPSSSSASLSASVSSSMSVSSSAPLRASSSGADALPSTNNSPTSQQESTLSIGAKAGIGGGAAAVGLLAISIGVLFYLQKIKSRYSQVEPIHFTRNDDETKGLPPYASVLEMQHGSNYNRHEGKYGVPKAFQVDGQIMEMSAERNVAELDANHCQ